MGADALHVVIPCVLLVLACWFANFGIFHREHNSGYPDKISVQLFRTSLTNTNWIERWSSAEYLRAKAGEEHVAVEAYPQNASATPAHDQSLVSMCLENHSIVNLTLSALLDYLNSSEQVHLPMYLADRDVPMGLIEDIPARIPLLTGLWRAGHEPNVISLFLGNGSATEYHYDMRYSALAVQVAGTKRFVVAPPSATPAIGFSDWSCRFGALDTCAAPTDAWPGALHAPGSQTFDLEPGDALYIPKFYWHAAYSSLQHSRGPGITVSYIFPEWLRFSNFEVHPMQIDCCKSSYGPDTLWLTDWL